MKPRLAIITTHPIQYHAPVFKLWSQRGIIDIKVFYTWGEDVLKDKYDPGFGKVITWDIPLLDGYDYMMVKNTSSTPGSHHHNGIINPTLHLDVESWGADVILVYGWNFHSHLRIMRYFKGKIPVFFRGDSTLLDRKPLSYRDLLKNIILRRIYNKVDLAFYVGKANRKYFELLGLKDHQLVFAPHAIDNRRFSLPAEIDFRSVLKLNTNDKLILFAGKFEEKKNPALLIQAFESIDDDSLHLWMVGNGPQEAALKSMVSMMSLKLRNRIHFMDFQNQMAMPDVYKACDLFVLPSKGPGETWGLAINEAMASSKAIIASDKCGAADDLIVEGINGYIFHSGDVQMLRTQIIKAIVSKSMLEEMGFQSQRMIQNWSFENICRIVEAQVFKSIGC